MDNMNVTQTEVYNNHPQILFEVISPLTYEDALAFNKFGVTIKRPYIKYIYIITLIIIAFNMVLSIISKNYFLFIISLVSICFMLFIYPQIIKMRIKKQIDSPLLSGNVNTYKFYQDCYVNTDNSSVSTVYYIQVIEAYETKEFFYIFNTPNTAHIIPKRSFVYNTPEEMRVLLSIKLGQNFKITY